MELSKSNSQKRNQNNNLLGYFKKLKPTPEQPELSESKVADYVVMVYILNTILIKLSDFYIV